VLDRIQKLAGRGLVPFSGILGAVVMLVVWPPLLAAAGPATCDQSNHWYAQTQSGCCSYGTGIETTTPLHWSVNRASDSTTDEAAWVIDNNNEDIAIEAGYYSGFFPTSGTWTNSLVSYATLNQGETGIVGTAIAANSDIFMDGWAINYIGGSCGPEGADVAGTSFRFCYDEPSGWNFAQGEVTNSTATWMGGGTGESFTAYYSNDHTDWYLWGTQNGCWNSPYWLKLPSKYTYSNGGK